MSDYKMQSSKFHKETSFTSTGVIGEATGHKLYGEQSLQIVLENVNSGTTISVQGKLAGQASWDTIKNIAGNGRIDLIDISEYDYLRFVCDNFKLSSTKIPRLIATGFFTETNPVQVETLKLLSQLINIMDEMACTTEKMRKSLDNINTHIAIMSGEKVMNEEEI